MNYQFQPKGFQKIAVHLMLFVKVKPICNALSCELKIESCYSGKFMPKISMCCEEYYEYVTTERHFGRSTTSAIHGKFSVCFFELQTYLKRISKGQQCLLIGLDSYLEESSCEPTCVCRRLSRCHVCRLDKCVISQLKYWRGGYHLLTSR